jgi:lysozyme
MQVTVFMAGFMAREPGLVKGVRSGPASAGAIDPVNRLQRGTFGSSQSTRFEIRPPFSRRKSRLANREAVENGEEWVRRMIQWTIGVTAILAVASVAYFAYDFGMVRFNNPSLSNYPIQGIDVSHHQGDIDWQTVGTQGNVRFAIMKATEGGDHQDSKFAENWQHAKDAGVVRGAYHFFTFCRPGKDQAQNVLATVPREPGTLPIAIDLEFVGNCNKVPTLEEMSAEVNAFFTELKGSFPEKPIFYVTQEFFDQYLKGNETRFPDHYLWLRSVFKEPKQEDCGRWSIWQFADNGTLDGIQGSVDLNVLCPSETGFAHLFRAVAAN